MNLIDKSKISNISTLSILKLNNISNKFIGDKYGYSFSEYYSIFKPFPDEYEPGYYGDLKKGWGNFSIVWSILVVFVAMIYALVSMLSDKYLDFYYYFTLIPIGFFGFIAGFLSFSFIVIPLSYVVGIVLSPILYPIYAIVIYCSSKRSKSIRETTLNNFYNEINKRAEKFIENPLVLQCAEDIVNNLLNKNINCVLKKESEFKIYVSKKDIYYINKAINFHDKGYNNLTSKEICYVLFAIMYNLNQTFNNKEHIYNKNGLMEYSYNIWLDYDLDSINCTCEYKVQPKKAPPKPEFKATNKW